MTILNPVIELSGRTESFNEFVERHKMDWEEINFKQYQKLFLKLLEDYFYSYGINDDEFREILQTLCSKIVEREPRSVANLKELIYQLHKYSNDTGSRWFIAFLDDAQKYFDSHTHLLY